MLNVSKAEKKRRIKHILKYLALSVLAVIIVIVASFLSRQRWFLYIGSILALLFIWVLAIVKYDSVLDIKAQNEVVNLAKKKKEKEKQEVLPTFPDGAEGEEDLDKFVDELNVTDELSDKKVDLEASEDIEFNIDEIRRLKHEMFKIDSAKEGLMKQLNVLHIQRKKLKEKILELI